jgi:hypothetical protein
MSQVRILSPRPFPSSEGVPRPQSERGGLDEHIGFEDIPRGVERRAFDRIEPADPGIVDQHVNRTGVADRCGDGVGVGDVEREDAQLFGMNCPSSAQSRSGHRRHRRPASPIRICNVL